MSEQLAPVTPTTNGKGVTAALVLAGPERRRLMLELLSQKEPWTTQQRVAWEELVQSEYHELAGRWEQDLADRTSLRVERDTFVLLLTRGISVDRAKQLAAENAAEAAREIENEAAARAKLERQRRRRRKTALEELDARTVVRLGAVEECIVCGKPRAEWRRAWSVRRDRAYCSPACRQRAYRQRKAAS